MGLPRLLRLGLPLGVLIMDTLSEASTSPTALPSVAACIAGQIRTFVREDTRHNIHAAMIHPIRDVVDVFASLSLDYNHSSSKYLWNSGAAAYMNGADTLMEMLSLFRVDPSCMSLRHGSDALDSLTSHTPCIGLISRRESARGLRYTWIMRLRGDVSYSASLPPYHRWPDATAGESRVLYTNACRHDDHLFAEERATGQCVHQQPIRVGACIAWRKTIENATVSKINPLPPRILGDFYRSWREKGKVFELSRVYPCGLERGAVITLRHPDASRANFKLVEVREQSNLLGCVKDMWGLMTRQAADVYFDGRTLEGLRATAAARGSNCFVWTIGLNECYLGCALHAQSVEVRLVRTTTGGGVDHAEGGALNASTGHWMHLVRAYASSVSVAPPAPGREIWLRP